MPKKIHVQATVNGKPMDFLCEPRQSLLEVLRDELRLTGSKEGCNNGNCGACNVILSSFAPAAPGDSQTPPLCAAPLGGRLVNSCLVLAAEVQGQSLTTIEGVAPAQGLHPLQRQFLEHAALQCGICTPGFIVAAKALLAANPNPTEDQVRHWLAGNLCRCTGYDKIVRAVLDAARGS
jgi:carbon-monoxide dehydrogenase small subunit